MVPPAHPSWHLRSLSVCPPVPPPTHTTEPEVRKGAAGVKAWADPPTHTQYPAAIDGTGSAEGDGWGEGLG